MLISWFLDSDWWVGLKLCLAVNAWVPMALSLSLFLVLWQSFSSSSIFLFLLFFLLLFPIICFQGLIKPFQWGPIKPPRGPPHQKSTNTTGREVGTLTLPPGREGQAPWAMPYLNPVTTHHSPPLLCFLDQWQGTSSLYHGKCNP